MFSGLRKKIILNTINSQLNKREVYNCEIKLHRLGILVDARNKYDISLIEEMANAIGVETKELQIMSFKDVKASIEGKDFSQINYFDDKMISFKGNVNSKPLNDFIQDTFDVLINFYHEDHTVLNLVAASSKAKFKVGFTSVDNRINDLVIGTPINNTDLFIHELKKYLKILNII